MRRSPLLLSLLLSLFLPALGGCRARLAPTGSTPAEAERTVFTDSALHAERCEPPKAGEDWRRVCTPVDQAARLVRPAPPERP